MSDELTLKFLRLANHHVDLKALFEDWVDALLEVTGCRCIGIRVLQDDGDISYSAYRGFSDSFYSKECALSIRSDRCMCIYVIVESVKTSADFITEYGSFYSNATSKLLATATDAEKGSTRNECNKEGYESVALIPIHFGEAILGLIHLADEREGMVPLETVQDIEAVAEVLGDAMYRIRQQMSYLQAAERLAETINVSLEAKRLILADNVS